MATGDLSTHNIKDIEYHRLIAKEYDAVVVSPRVTLNDVTLSKFIRHLQNGKIMLDLGCGTGHATLRFSHLYDKCIAVDHSPEMLDVAKKNIQSAQCAIVFNGEIYNFQDIKDQLTKKKYVFSTKSDTEVILASYLEWGPDCVKKFNGMWAFALWDNLNESLFLSKDRIGEKPLHYTIYNVKQLPRAYYFLCQEMYTQIGLAQS